MVFEFTASPQFDFITRFAEEVRAPVYQNKLRIPVKMGEGFIRKLSFGDDFRVLMHSYRLKEDLIIRRNPSLQENDFISIFFYNNVDDLQLKYNQTERVSFSRQNEAAVQVTTNDFSSTIHFPAKKEIQYLVLGITARKLRALLSMENPNAIVRTITGEKTSFLFFERMTAQMRLLLKNISLADTTDELNLFYLKIKAQELLYLLFRSLSSRENKSYRTINNADAEMLLEVQKKILSDLSLPPVLSQLAALAKMSETKLKQLFKQTFGETIYNYYQIARMEQAAFLLGQAKWSVSEVGYELGFSNLSHFGRIFSRHYGMSPKKYSSAHA